MSEGVSFLGSLANVLKQPHGAEQLADALVTNDLSTGQTTLNIPVPDKQTVANLFSALATLLSDDKRK